ncbi:hypothetical protein [Siphonobacter sp.]|uniref:hypothetical protein n=1 Tax=Siphonobacter sp. TaxID=1869184 RepID=UPI003B3BAB26
MENIKLSEVLEAIKGKDASNKPVRFSIKAVTLSLTRNTGGELITWEGVQLARDHADLPVTERREYVPVHRKRLPEVWKSGIIKIYNPTTKRIIDVRIRLITEFKLFTDPHWREVRL